MPSSLLAELCMANELARQRKINAKALAAAREGRIRAREGMQTLRQRRLANHQCVQCDGTPLAPQSKRCCQPCLDYNNLSEMDNYYARKRARQVLDSKANIGLDNIA